MNFKKYFSRFLPKNKPVGQELRHKRKFRILYFLIPLIFLLFAGVAFAQAPNIRVLAAKFIKPKFIVQSSIILSANIQSAIQNLASQEIKAESANANLAVNTLSSSSTQPSQSGLIQPIIDSIQETLTQDPSNKAKIRLRVIDREIIELQNLLEKDKSEKAADQAVKIIGNIGQKTKTVATDPKVQTDKEILKLQIEQYNRLQLILQKLEDHLPIASYLKIEDARMKYLVSGAIVSLNAAPNLDAVHNIAIKEVGRLVGDDFAELKAIEVLSDIESGLNPETKIKLVGLQKELSVQFEKRMLSLPPDVRNRKLQNYINYSFGNPIRQVQAFDQMKNFLTDRELILSVEGVKELSLGKLKNRVFEINTEDTRKQFWDSVFKDPKDIRVMALLQMYIQSGKSEADKKEFAKHEDIARARVAALFGQDPQALEAIAGSDILDLSIVSQIDQILEKSPVSSPEVKLKAKQILGKTLSTFLSSVSQKDFVSKPKLSYNPVTDASDVRLLSPNPQTILLLRSLGDTLPATDQQKIVVALRAQASLLQEHLLANVNDPVIFEQYQAFIANNPQVKQTIQSYVGQGFFTGLAQKKKLIDKQSKEDQQALYEKMQQIVQQIFIAPDGQLTDVEKQLSTEVQTEINKLRQELVNRNVPKLTTPEGVTLPDVAKLPDDVNAAIIAAAKQEIKDKTESKLAQLDLTVKAKDLGVSEPTILPGNLLYPVIEVLREIPVLLTSDPVEKAEKQLSIDNSRTLEAAKLLEGSQSQEIVDLALATLDKINQDFDLLKAHVDDLKKEEPAKVDQLVDQIIENGLARQTVLSSIENKVYGDDYVQVEIDRQDVLKNGIAVLLELTNQDAQKLTDKLEAAVASSQGSELKDIKAVELLTEISRTQPESVQQVLEKSEEDLAQNLETKLLAMPAEQRIEEVLAYAESAPGNPIRQFEAYDSLKSDFKNPEIIALAEGLKDKAVENLTQIISEITDASSRQEFVDSVVGNQPQDLKIITEIEQRVAPVETTTVTETLPIVEKIQDIKAEIEQNIIDTYKDKPEELAKTDFYQSATSTTTVDITDVKVAQEIITALTSSPEVSKEVIAVAKQEETKIIDTLVENISKLEFQTPNGSVTTLAAETLNPAPETIAELVALKAITPPEIDAKIDIAIKAEVSLIEEHITTQINDPVTFQAYVAQIEENPIVANIVAQVGGTEFAQAIETKTEVIQAVATAEQTTLETTVAQIEKEIFSSFTPSAIEQTLPQSIQEEIQQIKQEVPQAQIPQVEVTTTVNVAVPQSTPEPVSVPTETAAPAPVVPEVKTPEPAQPAAPPPAVPGL